MKVRLGFVSNSSSSSFSCDICGHSESGWDASPSELGFVRCVNEHVICDDEALELEDGMTEEEEELMEDGYYDIPERACPICQFLIISDCDLSSYLALTSGISRNEVFEVVKEKNKRRKKLYDGEYVAYVCEKRGLNRDKVWEEIKQKFSTYNDFLHKVRYNHHVNYDDDQE